MGLFSDAFSSQIRSSKERNIIIKQENNTEEKGEKNGRDDKNKR